MNRFLTNPKPLTPKRNKKPREKENTNEPENTEKEKTTDTKSTTEVLHEAIYYEDANISYNILSKNRPFDLSMNKTMTKIEFNSNFTSADNQYMLLAVDECVVKALEMGESVTLRGENNDNAVLCTENQTFPIKIIESATTCLVMNEVLSPPKTSESADPSFEKKRIDGKSYGMGELCPPNDTLDISKLKDILHEDELVWNWIDKSEEEKNRGKKLGDLLMRVQMSIKEIELALNDLPVVKMSNGKYRYLSHQYRGEFYGVLIDLIDDDTKENISMNKIDKQSLRNNLPENVADEVIDWYLENRCIQQEDDQKHYKIDENQLIRDLIIVVLSNTHKLPVTQFYDILAKILPFGLKVEESHFVGICDIQQNVSGDVMSYLAPEDLPDNINDRMKHLFSHRQLWSMEQLRPFFHDLFKSKESFDKYLVLKCDYTLSSTNEIMYCGVRD